MRGQQGTSRDSGRGNGNGTDIKVSLRPAVFTIIVIIIPTTHGRFSLLLLLLLLECMLIQERRAFLHCMGGGCRYV